MRLALRSPIGNQLGLRVLLGSLPLLGGAQVGGGPPSAHRDRAELALLVGHDLRLERVAPLLARSNPLLPLGQRGPAPQRSEGSALTPNRSPPTWETVWCNEINASTTS